AARRNSRGVRREQMRLLLDTHVLIWALSTPRSLPKATAAKIVDPANTIHVSAASIWEIAIKAALGKIDAQPHTVASAAKATGFVELPISFSHSVRVRELAPHHRDPFDRMLVAQALDEGLSIVSQDEVFALYSAPRVWK